LKKGLEEILVHVGDDRWADRLQQIRERVRQATYFEPGSEEDLKLSEILAQVRTGGDSALIRYTERFDGVRLQPDRLRVDAEQLEQAHRQINTELLQSLRKAIENVRRYQQQIFVGQRSWFAEGVGIRYTPLERVGVCVPGASAPLPSTVIMTVVPAQVAGVREVVVVSPPRHRGDIDPVILGLCWELGVKEVYRLGGAQAVGALAYGTETIAPVDKIVGPGSRWVQMAKKKVFGLVDIDSVAGPSEVLILADDSANAAWVAADMLSQAEHAPGSAVVFTDSAGLAERVIEHLQRQLAELTRAEQTIQCLQQYSGIVVFERFEDTIEQANVFAAEHLEIHCGRRSRVVAEQIRNAGAVFVGPYTPVAVGDYWAGPSHTLPTGQTARFFSALTSNDFIKSISVIEYDQQRLREASAEIVRLAEVEGLDAHARSVQIRQNHWQ